MNLAKIKEEFALCKSWEERYRLLIKLSRLLPKLNNEVLASLPEIHGCESRLWFLFEKSPRRVLAYSDARLMQGILMIIQTALMELSEEELSKFNFLQLFNELKITPNLTNTRLNGIAQIQALLY